VDIYEDVVFESISAGLFYCAVLDNAQF